MAGDAGPGAATLVVSIPKGALAQRVEPASAQAFTVIWVVHVWLRNVSHVPGVWVCDDAGACGVVKVPLRLPASSRAQVALSGTSGLLIEQPAD